MNRRSFATRVALSSLGCLASGKVMAEGAAVRVGIIGHTGRGDYGHGLDTMWQPVPGCVVVAVADADATGLAAAKRRLGGVQGFADFHVMLAELKPDIVAIAPRHVDQHHSMALAAAAAGVRGMYIEKPYCRTPQEADEVREACRRSSPSVKVAVAHRNRHHPVLPVVRQLLADGVIGRVLELRGRGKEDHRSGALDAWVLGTHLFELASWLSGPPLACSGLLLQDGRPCTREDIRAGDEGVGPIAGNAVHARFEMKDGTPFFFDSRPSSPGEPANAFGLQVVGTRGVLDFRVDREPLVHLRRGNPHDPKIETSPWVPVSTAGIGMPEPIIDMAARVAGHRAAALDLIDAIRQDRPPLCDETAGAATVEMVCALFESHRLGGARVTLPLLKRDNPLARMSQ